MALWHEAISPPNAATAPRHREVSIIRRRRRRAECVSDIRSSFYREARSRLRETPNAHRASIHMGSSGRHASREA